MLPLLPLSPLSVHQCLLGYLRRGFKGKLSLKNSPYSENQNSLAGGSSAQGQSVLTGTEGFCYPIKEAATPC